MKKIILILVIAVLFTNGKTERTFAQAPSPRQHTVHLFNGKNLDGWYTFIKDRGRNNDPKKVFTVQDGMLHISGEEWGCITTNEEYKNYKLVVEYKWGEETHGSRLNNARDNGILFHSKGADGGY